jgi:chromate transporter
MTRLSIREIAAVFLRAGNLTFGGGDPTMAALYRELVEKRRALEETRYALAFALARLTPGTNVLAFCAAVGSFLRGARGAAVAVVAASLPSAALTVWLTHAYETGGNNLWMASAFAAMSAAVVGLMAAGVLLLARSQAPRTGWPMALAIAGAAAALAMGQAAPPVTILGAAALAGFALPLRGES